MRAGAYAHPQHRRRHTSAATAVTASTLSAASTAEHHLHHLCHRITIMITMRSLPCLLPQRCRHGCVALPGAVPRTQFASQSLRDLACLRFETADKATNDGAVAPVPLPRTATQPSRTHCCTRARAHTLFAASTHCAASAALLRRSSIATASFSGPPASALGLRVCTLFALM